MTKHWEQIRLFDRAGLKEMLDARARDAAATIDRLSDHEALSEPPARLQIKFFEQFSLHVPVLSDPEADPPRSIENGTASQWSVFLPYVGEGLLFRYRPTGFGAGVMPTVSLPQGQLLYNITLAEPDPPEFEARLERFLQLVRSGLEATERDVEAFHQRLRPLIIEKVAQRVALAQRNADAASALSSLVKPRPRPAPTPEAAPAQPAQTKSNEARADPDIRLDRRHGSGFYGVIWEGFQVSLDRKVAVKMIRPERVDSLSAAAHARVLAKVSHENVVRVYTLASVVDPDDDRLTEAVIMEWLEGHTLAERLEGPEFTVSEAQAILSPVLDGAEAIQASGIAHGDLHEGNVIMHQSTVKVIDISYAEPLTSTLRSCTSLAAQIVRDAKFAGHLAFKVLMHSDCDRAAILAHEQMFRDARTLSAVRETVSAIIFDHRNASAPVRRVERKGLPPVQIKGYDLSGEAALLLIEAAQDRHGRIMKFRSSSGFTVQTNGKNLCSDQAPRNVALWQAAIEQLVGYSLLRQLTSKGEGFDLTAEGFDVAELLSK